MDPNSPNQPPTNVSPEPIPVPRKPLVLTPTPGTLAATIPTQPQPQAPPQPQPQSQLPAQPQPQSQPPQQPQPPLGQPPTTPVQPPLAPYVKSKKPLLIAGVAVVIVVIAAGLLTMLMSFSTPNGGSSKGGSTTSTDMSSLTPVGTPATVDDNLEVTVLKVQLEPPSDTPSKGEDSIVEVAKTTVRIKNKRAAELTNIEMNSLMSIRSGKTTAGAYTIYDPTIIPDSIAPGASAEIIFGFPILTKFKTAGYYMTVFGSGKFSLAT